MTFHPFPFDLRPPATLPDPKTPPPLQALTADEIQRARAARGDPPEQKLGGKARERRVPTSRLGRMASFGGLAVGLSVGALSEALRAALRGERPPQGGRPLLSEANAERLVATLCRVRGAALKVGQLISMQDSSLLSPELQRIFHRVQRGADFMPGWQTAKVLEAELGRDWRRRLSRFEEAPFAAASIGQVHRAALPDGTAVAIKVQYPGVVRSLRSDVANVTALLRLSAALPRGLFAERTLRVLQEEMEAECDYRREADNASTFRRLLGGAVGLHVPRVLRELSSGRVLCMEMAHGRPLSHCHHLPQPQRDALCTLLIRLCLRELFEFRFMQSDPNGANFLFDPQQQRLTLLDFGSCRSFEPQFTDLYLELMRAAANGDREAVLQKSRDLGFLTGHECREMEEAHVAAALLLGEPFSSRTPYHFGGGRAPPRLRALLPPLLKHRLTPPPPPALALHRKLGGVLLSCAQLGGRVPCREMMEEVWESYRGGGGTPKWGGDPKGWGGTPN